MDLIAKGEAVLFLGSGASFECRDSKGQKGLSANGLRDSLCDTFLGGQAKQKSLQAVGDLVKSSADILTMQRHIGALYEPLQTTDSHVAISRYRWKAIVTTNYDLSIERGYENGRSPKQKLHPIISDEDDFASAVGDRSVVPLLKLHGCVSRLNDVGLPLILSSSEYARYRNRRQRLFSYLKDWCFDHPIIFCGYSIADENVRDILFDVFDATVPHKRYVLCNPDLIDAEVSMWAERKVDAVRGTFDGLMTYMAENISDIKLTLAGVERNSSGPLSKFITGSNRPSAGLSAYLSDHVDLIHADIDQGVVSARDFYRGNSDGFSWIGRSFDVDRGVTEELLLATIISDKEISGPELYVLLGYAGSGKSTSLKRFAWEAAISYGKPVFFLRPGALIDADHLFELQELIAEPLTLLSDSLLDIKDEVEGLFRKAKKQKVPIRLVGCARTNEWNVDGGELSPYVEETYDLLDLTESEIGQLVLNLKKNDCLGYMSSFSLEESIKYLKSKLQNQLLVALHEATGGKSFSEIVADEYINVVPTEAQRLYLDICTVHRVGVPVRAGTISRISGIRLADFHERLFKPLEHVVQTQFWSSAGDYVYKSRHPSIAKLVFDAAVPGEEERSAQLVRIIQSLNTGYGTDNEAVTKLIRAKQIVADFTDKSYAYAVFRAAQDSGLSQEVVDQHIAQFELLHKNGDLPRARHLIEQAIGSSRDGKPTKSTLHVKASILRRQARESKIQLDRDKKRQEARALLDRLISSTRDPHPFILKCDLLIDELMERLDEPDEASLRRVGELLKDIQTVLSKFQQQFPRDSYLAAVESRLATVMDQHPKATSILERAHKADKHTVFIAIRLAQKFKSDGRFGDAIRVLSETLKAAGPLKEVHFAIADCLRAQDESLNAREIIDHLRRSFSDGDSRYEAQFLYARHEFIFGDRRKATEYFRALEHAKLPPRSINESSEPVKVDGVVKKFVGTTGVVRPAYLFVRCVEYATDIYLHKKHFHGEWDQLTRGNTIEYGIAFSFRGAVAIDARAT